MIRAVTFDFWDTLVVDDSDEPRRARLGLPTKPQARLQLLVDDISQYYPAIAPEQVAEAFASANDRFRQAWKNEHRTPTVAERLRHVYDTLHVEATPGFPAVVDLVEQMEVTVPPNFVPGVCETMVQLAARYALGIVSDTIHTPGRGLRALLEQQGILQYFRSLVFSDEVGASKPNRVVFERASAELGIPLSDVVHVGDRESNDVDGPLALGMKAVLFTGAVDRNSAGTRASAVCREFVDLPRVVQGLDA
jgi:HAD superfamily hydrolase (TIGR01549 family)